MESQIIKTKTLPHHTNCIRYSDKPGITIGRHKAKRMILCKSRSFLARTCGEELKLLQIAFNLCMFYIAKLLKKKVSFSLVALGAPY